MEEHERMVGAAIWAAGAGATARESVFVVVDFERGSQSVARGAVKVLLQLLRYDWLAADIIVQNFHFL